MSPGRLQESGSCGYYCRRRELEKKTKEIGKGLWDMTEQIENACGRRGPGGVGGIALWIRALRAPFFQAVLVPLALGTAVAWGRTGQFHLGYFLLAVVGGVLLHAGTNLANDYFDHKSGADAVNQEHTRFSGGSRVIQEGLIRPGTILGVSLTCFAVGALIGLYLVYARGWWLLPIGMVGVASGYFYTATPLSIGYRGWGEVLTGVNFGPLVVLGSYYVQVRALSWEALVVSVPVGLLIAAILYNNEFSDYGADKAANKANLVVRMGPERALKGLYILLGSTYVVIGVGCALRFLPWPAAASLLTAPLAWKTAKGAAANCAAGSGAKMLPSMAGTVATHLATGLLLACGYLAAGVLE